MKRNFARNVELPIDFSSLFFMDEHIADTFGTTVSSANLVTSNTMGNSISRLGIKASEPKRPWYVYAVKPFTHQKSNLAFVQSHAL